MPKFGIHASCSRNANSLESSRIPGSIRRLRTNVMTEIASAAPRMADGRDEGISAMPSAPTSGRSVIMERIGSDPTN